MKGRLDLLANTAVILASLSVVAFVAMRWNEQAARNRSARPAYDPGDLMESLSGVDYGTADMTVVLYLSNTCRFCTDSMPFYRDLVQRRNAASLPVKFVITSQESVEVTRAYTRENSLEVDQFVSLAGSDTKLGRAPTPTLLLVGHDGKVRRAWVGQLFEESQREVFAFFSNLRS